MKNRGSTYVLPRMALGGWLMPRPGDQNGVEPFFLLLESVEIPLTAIDQKYNRERNDAKEYEMLRGVARPAVQHLDEEQVAYPDDSRDDYDNQRHYRTKRESVIARIKSSLVFTQLGIGHR